MRAVASLESSIEMRLPRRKVLKKRRRELLPERRAAWTANQSNSPAASASVERLIIPRKKKKVFQSRNKVAMATPGLSRPRMRRSPCSRKSYDGLTDLIRANHNSKQSEKSNQRDKHCSGKRWYLKNEKHRLDIFTDKKLLHILTVTRVIAVFRIQEGEAGDLISPIM
jgi:hypothetical protein